MPCPARPRAASARASGATNCWPSRSTAKPGQQLDQLRGAGPGRDRSARCTPAPDLLRRRFPGPASACRPSARYPASAARASASHSQKTRPPYPAGTRLGIPGAAQHQQAAQRAERRVGPGRERRHAGRAGVHSPGQRRDQPRQAEHRENQQRAPADRTRCRAVRPAAQAAAAPPRARTGTWRRSRRPPPAAAPASSRRPAPPGSARASAAARSTQGRAP